MLTASIRLLSATLMFCGCVVVGGEGGGGGWAPGHLCDFSPGVVTVTTTSPPNCHAVAFMPTPAPVVLDRHAWCRVAPLPSPLARPRTARWVSHTWFVDKALCDPDGWQYAVQFPDVDSNAAVVWVPKDGPEAHVRRRKWTRRLCIPATVESSP